MIGDKIHIKEEYYQTSAKMVALMQSHFHFTTNKKYVVAIGGESGSGKSVTAMCLQQSIESVSPSIVIHQDDYFIHPPQTNHHKRVEDITQVGMNEVDWKAMQQTIDEFKEGKSSARKPLVDYKSNVILSEIVYFNTMQLLIVEGTYSLALANIDLKIFMDRTYLETQQQRLERGREQQSNFLEEVLAIEHQLIRPMRHQADIIVLADYSVALNNTQHE